jgi:DnaJ-class molecular chaperone
MVDLKGMAKMDKDQAKKLFGNLLAENFSRAELKKAYRVLVMDKHPDHGGTDEEFGALTSAFKLLEGQAENQKKVLYTIDGQKLSDLGRGYPITENARTCERCEGLGFKRYSGMSTGTGKFEQCTLCGGDGLKFYPCERCKGTGRYIHPKSKKDIGECYKCKGTGKFYPFNKRRGSQWRDSFGFGFRMPSTAPYIPGTQRRGIPCEKCFGDGTTEIKTDGKPYYLVCEECHGIGEVKMFNPVIPRGLFKVGDS